MLMQVNNCVQEWCFIITLFVGKIEDVPKPPEASDGGRLISNLTFVFSERTMCVAQSFDVKDCEIF